VDVVRDLLDKQVVDRTGREAGRVDGILLEARPGAPPRLAAILVGPVALGERLHPVIGRVLAAVLGHVDPRQARPVEIALADITRIGRDVAVRQTLVELGADSVERRVRKWIALLSGGR